MYFPHDTRDHAQTTRLQGSSFNVGAKITGQRFSKTIAGPPAAKPIPKEKKPDWVVTDQTSPEQAAIYRLTADYNPLHIGLFSQFCFQISILTSNILDQFTSDPSIGKAANFGGVILHGLSTFGFAARAVLAQVGGNDPNALRFFGVRFTSPVRPGDALETSIWEVGPGPDGTTEVTFVTKDLTSGKICLGGGIAYVKKVEKSKL